jgi:serine/threonine protein kinase
MIKLCSICESHHDDTIGPCPEHKSPSKNGGEDRLIGKIVRDRYQITELLGKGAMGVVYKATQLNDGKDVAIKVLHTHLSSDADAIQRFQYEAKAASALMHPNIVRLYDFGMTQSGQPYIAMEFLEGRTLGEIIREKRFFNTKEALPVMRQICEALAEAHSYGVLHRDIKPANIMMMNRFGQDNFVVVLDFSISKVINKFSDFDTTTPGLVLGSPAYMSPERFKGSGGDFRADIYSMGIIMFQMLAGRPPFKSSDLYALMNDVVSTAPPLVRDINPESDVPDSLQETITRALNKEPKDRQSNIKQMLGEINDVYMQTSSLPGAIPALPARAYAGAQFDVAQPSIHRSGDSFSAAPVRAESGPVFDIDPGVTVAQPVQTLNPSQARKVLALEEQQLQLRDADLAGSGKWDKSLIVKTPTTGGFQRPMIRPPEKATAIPLELIALVAVIVIGIATMVITAIPGNSLLRDKINVQLNKDNPPAALAILNTWPQSDKIGSQGEAYADTCMAVGNAFLRRREGPAAAAVFEMVPPGSRLYNEARARAKQCRAR